MPAKSERSSKAMGVWRQGRQVGQGAPLRYQGQVARQVQDQTQGPQEEEQVMPKVGGKHFSYGPAGMKAAKSYAKKTGKKMTKKKPRKRG